MNKQTFSKNTSPPYTVMFANQSAAPVTIFMYQQPSVSSKNQLASNFSVLSWKALPVPPNQKLPLVWQDQLSYQWASTSNLNEGTVFSSKQNVEGNETNQNLITLTSNNAGAYEFEDLRSESGRGMAILQDGTVEFDQVAIAVAMGGDAMYASMAQPNITTEFQPVPSTIYVSYDTLMEPGTVLDLRKVNTPKALDFPEGSYSAVVTLLADLQWQVEYMPGVAADVIAEQNEEKDTPYQQECENESEKDGNEAAHRPKTQGLSTLDDDEPDRKYTGYIDTYDSGYEGVSAQIGYVAPLSVCYQTNTWVGIDLVSDEIWMQTGWASEMQPVNRRATYVEVNRYDDSYNIYYHNPLVAGVTYEIDKKDNDAVWTISGVEYHRESWNGIVNDKALPNAQYMVEVFDASCDYVPGTVGNRNAYMNVQVKEAGDAFAQAPFAHNGTTDPNGNTDINTADHSSDLYVWDTREELAASAQCSIIEIELNMEPEKSPLNWSEAKKPSQSIAAKAACEKLENYIDVSSGAQYSNIEWGLLTDDHYMSGTRETAALKSRLSDLYFSNSLGKYQKSNLKVDAFCYAQTGNLLLAATEVKKDWVAPDSSFIQTHLHDELARAQLQVEELTTQQPTLKLEDIFTAVSCEMGIDLENVGLCIARPKWVTPQFPKAKRRGKMEPKRAAGVYWLVEIHGTHVHSSVKPRSGKLRHLTRMLCVIDDHSGELFYSIAMP